MKMFKKCMSLLLVCAVSIVSVGCGNDTSQTTPASVTTNDDKEKEEVVTPAKEQVTLTIATYADPLEVDLVTAQASAYMKENPHVKLVVEPIAGDIWETLKIRMVANDEPDIFYMDLFQVAQFIDTNKLAPLDEALSAADIADFEPALLDAFRGPDGTLYGVPKDFSTLALYYNVEMFEDAGLTPPETWDDLEKTAQALTGNGVVGLTLQNGIDRVQPFFYSNGGSMMSDDGLPTFNNPKNIEAYEYWIGLFEAGYAKTPQQLGVNWTGDAFTMDMAAMTIEGNWMIQALMEQAPDMEYGVVPIPYKEVPASMQFTVAYSMSNNTDNPDVARDVIRFLTDTNQQMLIAESGRAIPSRNSTLITFLENWPDYKVFVEQAPIASEFNYGIISATVVDEAAKAMERILLDPNSTVQGAFDAAQENIDKALANQ
ncbi:MAG: hypothetical protein ATN36_02805 [Epulopiscium sp. Nele67-Bin005]|nr:MAG: hypothetical protein ATN36_02805 [Epulopiscium sp. Nele67-Bin005]